MYDAKELPCIAMSIKDGELVCGKVDRREHVVSDVDLAIQDLLKGRTVYVQQYGPTITAVQRTIAMALQKR